MTTDGLDYLRMLDLADGHRAVTYVEPGIDDPHSDGEALVCTVCHVPLNKYSVIDQFDRPTDEVGYEHSAAYRTYDHEPVPGFMRRDESKASCDFCGQIVRLDWVFIGDRVQVPTPDGQGIQDYGTNWAACDECARLLIAGDLDALAQRCLKYSDAVGIRHADPALAIASYFAVWDRFVPTIKEIRYGGPPREPARLNPRMMPKLQVGLLQFWKTAESRPFDNVVLPGFQVGTEDVFRVRFAETPPQGAWANHCKHLAAGIGVSELYWISSEFTQLAIMAGKDMTRIDLRRENLPGQDPEKYADRPPAGLMVFEDPIGEIKRPFGMAKIRGVSWTLVPQGVWINLYFQGEDCDPLVDVAQMRTEHGYLMCPNAGSGFVFDDAFEIPDELRESEFSYMFTILATWYLIDQPGVAETTEGPVDRPYARSYQRNYGRKPPAVRLVNLRKQPRRAKTGESATGRQLTVRVWRKGHWKAQPYGAKRALRRQIYVNPYIAGPDGAPLKTPHPKVNVLK